MLNSFRTHLLNLSSEKNDHVPSAFIPKALPKDLASLYDAVFQNSTSRQFKFALAHLLIEMIYASGLEEELRRTDPRVSYDHKAAEHFYVVRFSNPISSDFNFPLFISGELLPDKTNSYTADSFNIKQIASTNTITIYSTAKKKYISPTGWFETPAAITLSFDGNNMSQEIALYNTGIFITIGKKAGVSFTSSSSKTWNFSAERPLILSIDTVLKNLVAVGYDKILKRYNTAGFLDKALVQTNNIYKLAYILLAYVTAVENL